MKLKRGAKIDHMAEGTSVALQLHHDRETAKLLVGRPLRFYTAYLILCDPRPPLRET